MDVKVLYALRGWIAFVAFMDFGTAVRSYIEKRSFLSKTIYNVDNFVDEEYTTSRILGMYSILKALILIHCSLYIHYKPLLSMGIWSIIITLILYFSETIYFRAASLNFYVVFPFILNVLTLACLIYIQKTIRIWDTTISGDEDTDKITNSTTSGRKKRYHKKN